MASGNKCGYADCKSLNNTIFILDRSEKMKYWKMVFTAFLLLNIPLWSYDFYVSAGGSDANPGTSSRPVNSLVRAFERAQKLIEVKGYPQEGITVWIEPGNYSFNETLVIDSSVQGTADNPIVFKSNAEKAVFGGGRAIDLTSAKLVRNEEIFSRFASQARGKIFAVTITDSAIKELLEKPSAMLSQSGQMMTLAKYPNVGYVHIDKILDKGAVYTHGRTKGDPPSYSMDSPIGGVFNVLDKDVSSWEAEFARVQKASVTGYLSNDWYKENHRIASIDDSNIKLLDYSRYGIINQKKIPRRLIVKNLLCELDMPGEFYFDDNEDVLYFWPFGDSIAGTEISLWAGVPFVQINGAGNVRFENIVVEGVSQGTAVIEIKDSENVEFAGCVVRNCSRLAVIVDGGRNCGLRSCDIYDVPHHLTLNGGNVRKLIASNNYAVNCHFTQVQASDYYGRIQLRGVGQIFRNNLVHNFIGQVMTVGDNDHRVEYNEFFNIGIEEGDGGTIYSGAAMWSYGNLYRHNFLHHLMCIPQAHPRGGIYPDDHDAGDTIRENIFYKAAHRSILMNGGAANTVESNIFLDGYIGIYNTCAYAQRAYERIEKYESGELKRGDKMDYVWRTEQVVGKQGWNNEPWISKYPKFAKVMNQEKMRFWPIECVVKDNLFSGNVYDMQFRTGTAPGDVIDMRESEYIQTSGNGDLPEGVFTDPEKLDFNYKNDKLKSRLPDIEFDKIGLHRDEFRITPPDKDHYRKAVRDKFKDRKSYDPDAKYDPVTINSSIYFNTGKLLIQEKYNFNLNK
jgi:hypothetical protein